MHLLRACLINLEDRKLSWSTLTHFVGQINQGMYLSQYQWLGPLDQLEHMNLDPWPANICVCYKPPLQVGELVLFHWVGPVGSLSFSCLAILIYYCKWHGLDFRLIFIHVSCCSSLIRTFSKLPHSILCWLWPEVKFNGIVLLSQLHRH